MSSATPPARDRPDLVLHIGSGKTGTTSIQHFLRRNRARLAEQGTLYPQSPGKVRHARFGLFARTDAELNNQFSWHKQKASSPAEFRAGFTSRLLDEIDRARPSRLLISDEALYSLSAAALTRLRDLTDEIARGVRAVVYLRRQDDHLCSRYQQVVKIGEVRRFAERTAATDFTAAYDYAARLRAWKRLVEPAQFVVRPFERDRFEGGSLYDDFLAAAGLDTRSVDLEPGESRNESLDAECVEFLRLHNIYRVEQEGARPGFINNRKLVVRLADISTGPTLTLPEPVLDAFMARWEDSNRAVAEEFLSEQTLFQTPRRTRNTTTDQVLDPARLEHFFTVLGLPEHEQAPLRRIAEREARAG